MAADVVAYEWNSRSGSSPRATPRSASAGRTSPGPGRAPRHAPPRSSGATSASSVPAGPHGLPGPASQARCLRVFRQAEQPAVAMRLLERAVPPTPSRESRVDDRPDPVETVRGRLLAPDSRSSSGPRDPRQAVREPGCRRTHGSRPSSSRCSRRCSRAGWRCERSAPCRRAHRRDHWATRRRRGEAGSPLTSSTFSAWRKLTMSRLPLDFVHAGT